MQFRSDIKVELLQYMGTDITFAQAARVSTKGAFDQKISVPEADEGLVRSLIRNHHSTPFEHSAMTLRIELPLFVVAQWQRHRVAWSYSQASGRYSVLDDVFYMPSEDRPLVQDGKAMSYKYIPGTTAQYFLMVDAITGVCESASRSYEAMLKAGIAKEVARMVLPVNTYTSMYVTCNARSLMNFLALRADEHAQWEIRDPAKQMEKIMAGLFPVAYDEWSKTRVAP